MRQLKLEFRPHHANTIVGRLEFEVYDHPVAHRWFSVLRDGLTQKTVMIEKTFCFLGWPNTMRDGRYLKSQIMATFREIANWPMAQLEDLPIELLQSDWGQAELNLAHHFFERMMGQIWDPQAPLRKYSSEQRRMLSAINEFIHELEAFTATETEALGHKAFLNVSTLPRGPLSLLSPEDYKLFKPATNYGEVYLKYAQLGKSFYQAWKDRDPHIHRKNLNGLRYCSKDFCINFYDSDPPPAEFYVWLRSRGYAIEPGESYFIDEFGQRQSIGYLPLAKLSSSHERKSIESELAKWQDLFAIELWHGSDRLARLEFPYFWDEPQYSTRLRYAYLGFRPPVQTANPLDKSPGPI